MGNKSEMKLFSLLVVAAVQAKQVTVFDAAEIGADCVVGEAACKDPNAECVVPPTRAGEKCSCKAGFVPDVPDAPTACVEATPIDADCDEEADPKVPCTGVNQICKDKKCACDEENGFVNDGNGVCAAPESSTESPTESPAPPTGPGFGEDCDDTVDGKKCAGEGLVCSTDKKCACAEGYEESEKTCKKTEASSAVGYGLGATLLTILFA